MNEMTMGGDSVWPQGRGMERKYLSLRFNLSRLSPRPQVNVSFVLFDRNESVVQREPRFPPLSLTFVPTTGTKVPNIFYQSASLRILCGSEHGFISYPSE